MIPAVAHAATFAAEQFHRLRDAARRHPVRAALVLPALVLLYVLVLIPFANIREGAENAEFNWPVVKVTMLPAAVR